jgi:diacylglycerol O-acyltransferase
VRQLTSADWMMVALDAPHAHNTIGMAGIYDPEESPRGAAPTYEEVLRHIEARLHVTESFRERMVNVPFGLDRPWWIRDGDFDLEYHVREIALPAPGSWRQFCTQIARIHSRPLDLSRPPWELYLISGLDGVGHVPPGAFATFLRIHHAAIDGVAGAEILTALHTNTADGPAPSVPEGYSWKPDRPPSDFSMLRKAAVHGVVRPVDVVRTATAFARQLPGLRRDLGNPEITSPASLPRGTRFNQTVSAHRVFGTSYTTLDVLKEIRKAVPECTINDIGLAIVGGAMRSYLIAKDELPEGPLSAMMPIATRPTMSQTGGAKDAGIAPVTGNEYSVAPISMATDEPDPLKRLARIAASTAHVKQSGAQPIRSLIAMAEVAFGGTMGTVQRAAVRVLAARGRTVSAHTLCSNVPGPATPIYFCGAKMVDTTGLGPVLDGMGLNNGIGSYGRRMTFCFTSDRDAMPDPEFYEECLAGAIQELLEASTAQQAAAGAKLVRNK